MKTEHNHAQLLRWIADGEMIQHENRSGWRDCCSTSLLLMLSDGSIDSDLSKFRIKPRTVKIGSREVSAPVLRPAEWQNLWHVTAGGEAFLNSACNLRAAIAAGRAFASREAALAAHDAITALLRGES